VGEDDRTGDRLREPATFRPDSDNPLLNSFRVFFKNFSQARSFFENNILLILLSRF